MRLRALRERLGLKTWKVAQALEMSTEGYRMYEVGRARIVSTDLPRFASALGVTTEQLVRSLGILGDDVSSTEPTPLSDEEQAELARLDRRFKHLMFATGRKYVSGSDDERRTYLNVLKALAGEEYREPIEDEV